ncbi:TolC family protein, partial [Hydrogenophaga sp.]|uniref:TolC family protein n=1 Tax=Hydrogenophaga sp. TaxID=1904254 RepID=UPI0027321E79
MKHLLAVTACAALLSACSVTKPPTDVAIELPGSWYAPPLAHSGSTQELSTWWSRFDDPVLTEWIARAQAQSPSIATARAQVFAARATRFGVKAQNGPQVNAVANASRGITDPTIPLGTSLSAGLQASWAIGLWGESSARLGSVQAQQDAAGAGWHEARVLVASELAQLYFSQRLCREQLAVALRDRDSRAVTA